MLEFGIKKPNITYVERPGAYGIAIKDTLAFLVKRPAGYCLPGGGIDEGETAEECLKREILEEIGYEVLSYKKIAEVANYLFSPAKDDDSYCKKICHFYLITLGEKITDPVEKNHEPEWVDIYDALPKIYQEAQAWILQKAIKSL